VFASKTRSRIEAMACALFDNLYACAGTLQWLAGFR